MTIKQEIAAILLAFTSIVINAQNISVSDFHLDEMDQAANIQGTTVLDQNGEKCALIKVITTQTGFTFDVGMLGVQKTVQKPGEIWVYVPAGVRKMSISHPQIGQLRDYQLPVTTQKAKTYVMKLTAANVRTIVEAAVTSQFVVFQVEPNDAIVELNGEALEVTDGIAQKYVPFGTYKYNVEAADYHSIEGTVNVNNPDNKAVVSVSLKPAFGWIDIHVSGEMKGAKVYVDNKLLGNAPLKTNRLSSGQHNVKLIKSMYKPWEQTVTVTDNETATVSPSMSADFSTVTLNVGNNAEIWVNGEKKGSGTWTGKLGTGEYKIDTRLAHHRNGTLNKTITSGQPTQTITLPSPTAICGNVSISVTPGLADITIDGKPAGQTPNVLRNILEGEHTVRVSKSGYAPYMATVTVKEGQTSEVSGKLQSSVPVSLSAENKSARIWVDGADMGTIADVTSLGIGTHTIKTQCGNETPVEQTIIVTADGNQSFAINVNTGVPRFTVGGVTFEMVKVQGGTFTMGATSEQGSDAESDEKPTHQVTLSNYCIGKYEVTQALWQAVMNQTVTQIANANNWKTLEVGDNYPMYDVSWNDCQDFISKLNSKTGRKFRLPTEAEWEYAARGGNKSQGYKYSGSNKLKDVAWFYKNSGNKTHEVGTKQPNELGIYDMSGNVWEWCSDWYGSYSSSSQTNPTGASSGSDRVFRGGGWLYIARYCRSSYRGSNTPDGRNNRLGLRLVLSEF